MEDIDFSRRGIVSLLAALPTGGTWIWKGPMRPPGPEFKATEIRFDAGGGSTTERLSAAATREEWLATLESRLALPRRVRVLQGEVERMRADLNGSIAVDDGQVTSLGTVANPTASSSPETGAGEWEIRIEGGPRFGAFVRVGLEASGDMASLSSEAAAGKAMEVLATLRLPAPATLPARKRQAPAEADHAGNPTPAPDANAPVSMTLQDWTQPGKAIDVGTIKFDVKAPDWVFEDTDINAEIGAIGVRQSSNSIVFGGFEFSATCLICGAHVNDEANAVVYQVIVAAKPHGRWRTYPAADTFDRGSDTLFPPALKVVVKKADGSVAHTFEMPRDGKPINDPSLSQTRAKDGEPLRPHWNCGSPLVWSSARTKMSSRLPRLLPGYLPDALRPSQSKQSFSANGPNLFIRYGANGRTQYNNYGPNHFYTIPAWSLGWFKGPTPGDPSNDPYCYDPDAVYSGDGPDRRIAGAHGWRYEPGNPGGHEFYTGPGGVRNIDRVPVPTPLAILLSDRKWRRPKDGAPIREMADHFGLAYFNHPCHWFTDVKTLQSIDPQQGTQGQWAFTNAYYGVRADYVPGGLSRHIDLVGIPNGGFDAKPSDGARFYDKTGRRFWNGWLLDHHHTHQAPALWTIALNSPMHALSTRSFFYAQFMSALGGSGKDGLIHGDIFFRTAAWRFQHMGHMWKVASRHPTLGLSRALVESRIRAELESIYDRFVAPYHANPKPSKSDPGNYGLRHFGSFLFYAPNQYKSDESAWLTMSTSMVYYISPVFAQWKQFGLWAAMKARSPKCAAALDWYIEILDRYCFDFILDTNGQNEGSVNITRWAPTGKPGRSEDIPDNWAAYQKLMGQNGEEDWIRGPDGKFFERYSAQHLRAQYAMMRRDYFPEYNHPRMGAAIKKFQSYYDAWAAQVARQRDPAAQRNADWPNRVPGMGFLAAPTAGPASA